MNKSIYKLGETLPRKEKSAYSQKSFSVFKKSKMLIKKIILFPMNCCAFFVNLLSIVLECSATSKIYIGK